jgi:hypothetical protein
MRHLREYTRWKDKAETAGFLAKVGSFGHTDGIAFSAERDGDPSRSFWVGCRERGVILHLPSPKSIYHIQDSDRVGDLSLALLTRMKGRPGPVTMDPDLVREYGLTVIPTTQWYDEEIHERTRRLSAMGWLPLDYKEEDAIVRRVSETFVRDGGGANWLREPVGSLTWDTTAAYAGGEAAVRVGNDLTLKLLRAFQRCTRPGELLYAFEYHGPVMSFDPRTDVTGPTRNHLAVPILPDGDPVFFVAKDLRFGLLAPYPKTEICTFGPDLIESLGEDWPPPLINLLRTNG